MYSFMAMWLLLATYALHRGTKHGGLRCWILFSASAALAQYTHNLSVFYLLPLAATPDFPKELENSVEGCTGRIGCSDFIPALVVANPIATYKSSNATGLNTQTEPKDYTLLLVYVTNLPLPNNSLLFASLFIALTVISIAIMQTFRRANRNANALWLMYLAFMPPILLFVVSQWVPVYIERACQA